MNRVLLLVASVILYSCSGELITDPIDPRLPKYTEEGNNVAGALINSMIWESRVEYKFLAPNKDAPEIKSFHNVDSLMIIFDGRVGDHYTQITFQLSGLTITNTEELLLLKGSKFQFDAVNNSAIYHQYNKLYKTPETSHITNGQIYFRHAELDNYYGRVILSGTFGFTAINTDNEHDTIEVIKGRFDYKFDDGNVSFRGSK